MIIREIEANFGQDLYTDAFRKFHEWTGTTEKDTPISYDIFKYGYQMFAFDLLENCSQNSSCHEEMINQGFIEINI